MFKTIKPAKTKRNIGTFSHHTAASTVKSCQIKFIELVVLAGRDRGLPTDGFKS